MTEHLPEVKRWDSVYDPAYGDHILKEHDAGRFVTYADHVAALAEAEHEWACGKSRSVQDCGCRLAGYAEARAKWADIGRDAGYDEGYAAALGKSREAVAPFVTQDCGVDDCTRHYSPALGAIDRLIRAAGQAPAAPLGECPDCGHQQSSHDKDGYCNDTDCFYDTDPCSVSGEAPAAPGEVT